MRAGLRIRPAARGVAALLALLVVAGCGGPTIPLGGGATHETSPLAVNAAQATAWVSTYRKEHGLAGVTLDPALERVAQAQADAMASAGQLSHTVAGPLPRRLARIERDKGASAENVSAGYHDLASALAGWQRSPEHNKNLLFAPIRRIGVAGAAAPGTRYKTFWALVMTD